MEVDSYQDVTFMKVVTVVTIKMLQKYRVVNVMVVLLVFVGLGWVWIIILWGGFWGSEERVQNFKSFSLKCLYSNKVQFCFITFALHIL